MDVEDLDIESRLRTQIENGKFHLRTLACPPISGAIEMEFQIWKTHRIEFRILSIYNVIYLTVFNTDFPKFREKIML